MTEQTQSVETESAQPGEAIQPDQAVVAEALTVIDGALGQMMQRELISSGEVADLLLDVRSLLTSQASDPQDSTPEPVA